METLQGMLARTIHEDRARELSHPRRRHAAELRDARRAGPSRLGALLASIGLTRRSAAAGTPCTTADGRAGRLVAREDGGSLVLVCELG